MTILVTGASGFIGRHLVKAIFRCGFQARAAVRTGSKTTLPHSDIELVNLSGAGYSSDDWVEAVSGCSVVVHLAARAHNPRDGSKNLQYAFERSNVDFSLACANAAVKAGVSRFIFMSSAGIHGGTSGTCPIKADDEFAPHTLYAQSKAIAERKLVDIVRDSGTELTVLRPPLVYGAGAPGNFGVLAHAVSSGWPLPLRSVTINRRSFVSVDNLINLIVTCLSHPAAANRKFLVSDDEDLSTADFLIRMGVAMATPARLLSFPVGWLASGSRLLGKQDMFQSLCGSFQLDISQTCSVLGWSPPYTLDEGLQRCFAVKR